MTTPASNGRPWTVNGRFLSEPFSGVQRVAQGFLRTLAGSECHLACPSGTRPPWWSGPVTELPLLPGRPGRMLWEQLQLPLRTRGPVLSLANTGPLLRPDAVYIHDVAFRVHPEWFRASFRRTYGWVTARVAAASRRVLVNSRFTADELVRILGVDTARITVIRPGVDERFRRPPDEEIEQLRGKRHLPDRFFLMVGSIDPRKGIDMAERAALSTSVPLVVAGAAPSNFADVPLPAHVIWLGPVSELELPALYASATALVYPSRYEGFGLPPIEAMACGTPVIASDIPPLRETVGDAALLVPADEADAWVEAARRVTASSALRRELTESGLSRARAFSWEGAGRLLAEVLAIP